jgi:hypothetical protein
MRKSCCPYTCKSNVLCPQGNQGYFHRKGIEIQSSLDTNKMNILKGLHCFIPFIWETTSMQICPLLSHHLEMCHTVSCEVTSVIIMEAILWTGYPKRYNIQKAL